MSIYFCGNIAFFPIIRYNGRGDKTMKAKKLSRRHRNLLLAGLGVLGFVVIFYILGRRGIGIPCLFRRMTGFQCPGCGNSRAVLALLRLDVVAALKHNLLFPVEFFYIGWVIFHCCRDYLRGKPFSYQPPWPWLDGIVLALVLLWCPLRNLL